MCVCKHSLSQCSKVLAGNGATSYDLNMMRQFTWLADEEDELDEDGNLVFANTSFEELSEREQKLVVLEDLLSKLSLEA